MYPNNFPPTDYSDFVFRKGNFIRTLSGGSLPGCDNIRNDNAVSDRIDIDSCILQQQISTGCPHICLWLIVYDMLFLVYEFIVLLATYLNSFFALGRFQEKKKLNFIHAFITQCSFDYSILIVSCNILYSIYSKKKLAFSNYYMLTC